MELMIDFPGGAKVDAHFSGFTVKTDQSPKSGGEESAPSPFSLFLASIGTCEESTCWDFANSEIYPWKGSRSWKRSAPTLKLE